MWKLCVPHSQFMPASPACFKYVLLCVVAYSDLRRTEQSTTYRTWLQMKSIKRKLEMITKLKQKLKLTTSLQCSVQCQFVYYRKDSNQLAALTSQYCLVSPQSCRIYSCNPNISRNLITNWNDKQSEKTLTVCASLHGWLFKLSWMRTLTKYRNALKSVKTICP